MKKLLLFFFFLPVFSALTMNHEDLSNTKKLVALTQELHERAVAVDTAHTVNPTMPRLITIANILSAGVGAKMFDPKEKKYKEVWICSNGRGEISIYPPKSESRTHILVIEDRDHEPLDTICFQHPDTDIVFVVKKMDSITKVCQVMAKDLPDGHEQLAFSAHQFLVAINAQSKSKGDGETKHFALSSMLKATDSASVKDEILYDDSPK